MPKPCDSHISYSYEEFTGQKNFQKNVPKILARALQCWEEFPTFGAQHQPNNSPNFYISKNYLWVIWHNQQRHSTEGRWLVNQSHQIRLTKRYFYYIYTTETLASVVVWWELSACERSLSSKLALLHNWIQLWLYCWPEDTAVCTHSFLALYATCTSFTSRSLKTHQQHRPSCHGNLNKWCEHLWCNVM